MRRLLFALTIALLPGLSFAAESKSRFSIFGFYGINMITPTDINNLQKNFSAPKPGDITTGMSFGGGLGMRLGQRVQLRASYDMFEAKNLNTGYGFTITQNMVWGDLNFMLVDGKKIDIYIGGGAGYPMLSHLRRNQNAVITEFDADKTVGYRGLLGLNFMLGNHFALFFEGSYQLVNMGTIRSTTGGTILTDVGGANAENPLTGVKGLGGLAVMF